MYRKIFQNIFKNPLNQILYLTNEIYILGRMYISTGYICFYSKIFGLEHSLQIAFQDVTLISKVSCL